MTSEEKTKSKQKTFVSFKHLFLESIIYNLFKYSRLPSFLSICNVIMHLSMSLQMPRPHRKDNLSYLTNTISLGSSNHAWLQFFHGREKKVWQGSWLTNRDYSRLSFTTQELHDNRGLGAQALVACYTVVMLISA